MTGLRPIAEIMFSDFFAVCWDIVANEIAKTRYMTNGQLTFPLVIRSGNGGGLRFGAQHSQSVENWAMMIPGLKVVVPSNAVDVIGLMAAPIRDDDPVIFLEAKALYATKMDVPDGEIVDTLGTAKVLRQGPTRRSWLWAHGPQGPRGGRGAGRVRHRLHRDRRAFAGARSTPPRSCARSRPPDDSSRSKRTLACAAGAPSWPRSSPTRSSTTSTDRSCASPRRTSPCRRPTRSRTWRFRRSSES